MLKFAEWKTVQIEEIRAGLPAPEDGQSPWYLEVEVEPLHLVVRPYRVVPVTTKKVVRKATRWRREMVENFTINEQQKAGEVRVRLPERVVELPLPQWATLTCDPSFGTEVWVAGANPASETMFVSEARTAWTAYQQLLGAALSAAEKQSML